MNTISPDFELARRQYMELHASYAVMNRHLRVAVLCLATVCVGLFVLNIKTYAAYHHLQPLVIRIDQLGRAEAVGYGSLEYHPQAAELKYFLTQFVQSYYGRMRATLRESYTHSLYFLDNQLAEGIMESNKKSKVIETFLNAPQEEIDIEIRNVALEDLRQAPYKATVEFEKVFYSLAEHRETRRERYTANVVFVVKQPVPNALVPVNPLGLTITYFREDQAFQ